MNDNTDTYLLFRLLVIPDNQINLLLVNTTKEDIVNNILIELSKNKTNIYLSESRRYIVYPLPTESENVLRFKLAKPVKKTLEQEGDDKIEPIDFEGVESINFIYYKQRQIILFEKSATVFPKIEYPAQILKKYIQQKTANYNLSIAVETIPSSQKIKEYINDAEKLFQVELNINQLNIGEGSQKVRNLLQEIKKDTNEDHIKMKFTNINGQLNAKSGFIDNAIDYISTVGGSVSLWYSTTRNKRKRKFNSDETIKTIELNKNINEESDSDIIDDINKISPPSNE